VSDYTGAERRHTPPRAVIADMVSEEMDRLLAQTETNLMNHMNQKMGQFELSVISSIKKVVEEAIDKHIDDAFPDGPLHRHKDHHQRLIDNAESGRKIRLDLQIWALRGAIAFVGVLLFLGAKEWLIRELAK
jgi:hypothetical protein